MVNEKGQTLVELVLILPIVFGLAWMAFDLTMLYRDQYLLDYSLFHGLRTVSTRNQINNFLVKGDVVTLLGLGLSGTSLFLPTVSEVEIIEDRLYLKGSILRDHEFGYWPAVTSELSTFWEGR